jgi:hypothetical protein
MSTVLFYAAPVAGEADPALTRMGRVTASRPSAIGPTAMSCPHCRHVAERASRDIVINRSP